MGVQNNLAELRQKRALSVARLAAAVGVSRQTIYAMESGSYVPNTVVSLKLARALAVTVEELFRLESEAPAPTRTEEVELLGDERTIRAGQPLRLCRVESRLVGAPPETGTYGLPAADAVAMEPAGPEEPGAGLRVRMLGEERKLDRRVLLAGCDPGASVLARYVERNDVDLVVAYLNSSRALQMLREGRVHIAGTHLVDDRTGEPNLPQVGALFGEDAVAVISYAVWEEGLAFASGNPKGIRSVADLAREDVRIVNREPGAGCRALLDAHLQRAGLSPQLVRGYDRIAWGHLPCARRVLNGEADCCVSTAAAARLYGLEFLPLLTNRYDLVVRKKTLELPPVQAVFEALGRAAFRRELEGLAGYDMQLSGDRLM